MIERFNKYLLFITRWCAWIGMGFLLAAMLVTTADILLRKLNSQGIFGAVDIVQLMIMSAAFLSIPYGFMTHSHVAVSVIVDHFNRKGTALTNLLAALLATGFMLAIAWFGWEQAALQAGYGDVSLTLGIPKIYYWIPLLSGAALSTIVCIYMSIEALRVIITGRSQFTPRPAGPDQGED